MFVRVLVFATTYSQLFANGTLTGELKDASSRGGVRIATPTSSDLTTAILTADPTAKQLALMSEHFPSKTPRVSLMIEPLSSKNVAMNGTIEQYTSIAKHLAVATERPSPVPAQLP